MICRNCVLIVSVLLLFAAGSNARACEVPNGGAEFDAQVQLSVLDKQANIYRLKVPLEMNETPFYKAAMTYWPKPKKPGQYQLSQEIHLNELDGVLVGQFIAPDGNLFDEIEVVVVYNSAMGGCGTYAYAQVD